MERPCEGFPLWVCMVDGDAAEAALGGGTASTMECREKEFILGLTSVLRASPRSLVSELVADEIDGDMLSLSSNTANPDSDSITVHTETRNHPSASVLSPPTPQHYNYYYQLQLSNALNYSKIIIPRPSLLAVR